MNNKSKVLSPAEVKEKQERLLGLLLLMVAAFITHVIFAAAYTGYEVDMHCFSWWSDAVFENGVGKFYSLDAFTDYPPGYMYVLYIIGFLRKITGLTGLTPAACVLLKMPAMLCDLGIGYVVFRVASRYTGNMYALLISAAFMFNPAVIINSATWGQVDAVFTLFVVLMCYFVTEKKLPAAYFMLAVGILIKPQTLIFTPVLIYGIIDQVFLHDFTWKRMFKELAIGLSAIAVLFLLAVPFGLKDVLSQYVDTLGSYKYASVNAYNLWTLLGFNWHNQNDYFMFLPFKTWGTVFILLTVAVSAWFCIRNRESESKYYLTGAFIVTSVFMLAVRMHERYMYPALALLLVACAVKRKKEYFIAYGALSFVQFLNAYHVLFYYDPDTYDYDNPVIYTIAGLSICAFAYFVFVILSKAKEPRALTAGEAAEAAERNRQANKKNNRNAGNKNNNNRASGNNVASTAKEPFWKIRLSEIIPKWRLRDTVIVSVITLVYACIAFYNLGDMDAPQTFWKGEELDSEIVLDFGKEVQFEKMFNYLGYYENRKFEVYTSMDGNDWTKLQLGESSEDEDADDSNDPAWMNIGSVFCWNEQAFSYNTRFVKFISKSDLSVIMEMMFYDRSGNVVTPVNTADYPELFDEQDIFDGKKTFMNSTYFDEIYHARTAYEMIHGLYCYENTHPPLGKAIMAIGILIFGMCPFGWRFMGTLIGVLMIPVIYLLGRRLTKSTWFAAVTTLLLAFDFMHFAQTRIATIDVYVTFFIMLMYYFMLRYYQMSFYDTPLKKTFIPLALSGACMGLACASKWTGVYGGVGLAVVFGVVMLRRYMEYRTALKNPKGEVVDEGTDRRISHQSIIESYGLNTMKTLAFCVVVFVVVPIIIYACSYIPFNDMGAQDRQSNSPFIEKVLNNQTSMYNYHSTLEATHPYESTWYQWPVMTRPILYYLESVDDIYKSGISSFGNPLVWWVGIIAFVFMLYLIFKEKDRIALFITIGYLAEYLPWMLVSRCTFIYHYFPSVPFVVMMIGYGIYKMVKKAPKAKYAVYVYAAAVIGLFFAFYPVLSGAPCTIEYAKMLKWIDTWVLLF